MFKRVMFEDWSLMIPMISFIIFFAVFVVISIRALRMEQSESKRLAALPLEQSPENSNAEPHTTL